MRVQTSFLCMSRVLPVCPWISAAGGGLVFVVTFPLKSDESSEWLHQPHLEFLIHTCRRARHAGPVP